MKTVQGKYCYTRDKETQKKVSIVFQGEKKLVRDLSIVDGIHKIIKDENFGFIFLEGDKRKHIQNLKVLNYTEKRNKICEHIQFSIDTEVIEKEYKDYQERIIFNKIENEQRERESKINQEVVQQLLKKNVILGQWSGDLHIFLNGNPLRPKEDLGKDYNLGFIIENKISDLSENDREISENKEEEQFNDIIKIHNILHSQYYVYPSQYKIIERRHLKNILEEHKLQSTGLTDSETVKIGKLLNLDIIFLRIIYKDSSILKVLRVGNGEVLLFKTYEEKENDGWVFYIQTEKGDWYYNKNTVIKVNNNIRKVWNKIKFSRLEKERIIQLRKEYNQSIVGYNKLDHGITLYEIDCGNNTSSYLENVEYNDEGSVLSSSKSSYIRKNTIIPDSIMDTLRKFVCE